MVRESLAARCFGRVLHASLDVHGRDPEVTLDTLRSIQCRRPWLATRSGGLGEEESVALC